jgi:hypothetical protein
MRSATNGGVHMRNLRWLAVGPAALGLVFLLVALAWTEWPQFFVGVGLLVLASVVWRVFAGEWLPSATQPKHPD